MKVYFANENPGTVRAEFMRSAFELIFTDSQTDRYVYSVDLHHGGAGVAMFRNQTIEKFLSTEADAIFFSDSDIKLQPDTLRRLVSHLDPTERPVVSGLYFLNMDAGLRPAVFGMDEPDAKGNRHMSPLETLPSESELFEADGVGAGCLLIHRTILEDMLLEYGLPQPWFADEVWYGEVYGEDLAFSQRVKKINYKIYVDPLAEVGHVKPVVLTKEMFLAQTAFQEANAAANKEMENA